MVWNLPANATDTGSIPDPGRSHMPWSSKAHAPEPLRPRAVATEASSPRARALQQEKPGDNQRAPQRSTTREAGAATESQHSQKEIMDLFLKKRENLWSLGNFQR